MYINILNLEGDYMSNLNQIETNAIRECVTHNISLCSKLSCYANKACEPDIKDLFKNFGTKTEQGLQKLIQIL